MRHCLHFLLLCCFLLMLSPAMGQVDNRGLEVNFPASAAPGGSLSLDVFSFNYFRNYEYFNRFADGLTYFGMQLQPKLVYRPNEHLSLYGGIFLQKDFGDAGIRKVAPLLGIRYEKNGLVFTSGAIEPHLSHRYIEPLLDYDKSITDPVEYGSQLKLDKEFHRTDLWVNWKNMIYKDADEQEEILGGVSSSLHLLRKDQHRLSLPLQVLAWHKGGQIDTTSLPVRTRFNLAAGLEYSWEREGAIEQLFTRNYILASGSSEEQDPSGKAFYLNAGLESKWFDLMLSYWQGRQFTAPAGAPLFQSRSSHIDHPGYWQDGRRLLFLRLKKDFTLADELFVSARLEPVWDLDGDYIDYSMSLYLVYQGFFGLIDPARRE